MKWSLKTKSRSSNNNPSLSTIFIYKISTKLGHDPTMPEEKKQKY